MKLDVNCMKYLTKDNYRVLQAVEMGMRNHELVPVELINQIAALKHGGTFKILSVLLRYKLVAHASNKYDGYRLSYLGYDILALRTLMSRGIIASVGSQIGVGKESDVFEAMDEEGNELVLKIHRLGRTSFRSVRRNRDYMKDKNKASWLYMSRLAATKEYTFMEILYERGFPTPMPISHNRHVVAMSKINGFPMCQIRSGGMGDILNKYYFDESMNLLLNLARHGLVHCDLNEFNIILLNAPIDTTEPVDKTNNTSTTSSSNPSSNSTDQINIIDKNISLSTSIGHGVVLIDFPQMVSTDHPNAEELFNRDKEGLIKFFSLKMKYQITEKDDIILNTVLDFKTIVDNNNKLILQAKQLNAQTSLQLPVITNAYDEVFSKNIINKNDDLLLVNMYSNHNIDKNDMNNENNDDKNDINNENNDDDNDSNNDIDNYDSSDEIDMNDISLTENIQKSAIEITSTGNDNIRDTTTTTTTVVTGTVDYDDLSDLDSLEESNTRKNKNNIKNDNKLKNYNENRNNRINSDVNIVDEENLLLHQKVKDCLKNQSGRTHSQNFNSKGSTSHTKGNQTKTRNKYGKIDRTVSNQMKKSEW